MIRRQARPFSRLLAFLSFVFLAGWVSPASAQTFAVNTKFDDVDTNPGDCKCGTAKYKCSLRAAVMEANVCPGSDTVVIPWGTVYLNIPGTGGDFEGDLDISGATGKLTIVGANKWGTVIDAATNGDRAFHVGNGAKVFMQNFSVMNGATGPGLASGGAMAISSGGELTLESVAMFDNSAVATGGAMLVSGEAELNDVSIFDNQAISGGGLAVTGTVHAYDSTIEDNEATPLSASSGGGVFVSGGRFEGKRVNIISNNAEFSGGGIYVTSGYLALDESSIEGNYSGLFASGQGGGGGLWVGDGSTALLSNSWIVANVTTANGGGISSRSILRLDNCTVQGNRSLELGGGISHTGAAGIFTLLIDSSITGNEANQGAGINANNGTLYAINATIAANRGCWNGGIYASSSGYTALIYSTVADNEATCIGGTGGISENSNFSGTLNLSSTVLIDNHGYHDNCSTTITANYSLVDPDPACNLTGANNQISPTSSGLGALTSSIAIPGWDHIPLNLGSPAIDAGDPSYCPSSPWVDQDQLGQTRLVCDIGAVERP